MKACLPNEVVKPVIGFTALACVFLLSLPPHLFADVAPTIPGPKKEKLDVFGYEIFDPVLPGLIRGNRKVLLANMLDRFGKPLNQTTVLRDYHDPDPIKGPFQYEEIIWYYDGLVIQMGSDIASGKDQEARTGWIQRVTVSSPQYQLQYHLRIGLKVDRFIAILGTPTYRDKDHVNYDAEDAVEIREGVYNVTPCQIEMRLDGKMRVKEIEWTWWWH